MGGRKWVSAGATIARSVLAGRTRVEAGGFRVSETLKASGTLPQWPWQPEDLQQSCLSDGMPAGAFACRGQASSLAAVVPSAATILAVLSCADTASVACPAMCIPPSIEDAVDAYATPACSPTANWNARSANKTRAMDKTRTRSGYSIRPRLSKSVDVPVSFLAPTRSRSMFR